MANLDLSGREPWVDELPDDFESGSPCPKCGSTNTIWGFGLTGGGMGVYGSCDDCDWFGKAPSSTEGTT